MKSSAGLGVAIAVGTAGLLSMALVVGPGEVDAGQAWSIVAAHLSGATAEGSRAVDALVWDLRLPRSLLAIVVGASLAAAGTVTQGLFRNPMAEPGVLGISAAAATTAVLGFLLGLDAAGSWAIPVMAAAGAAAGLSALAWLSVRTTSMTTLLLSGVALGALLSAVTTLMLSVGTERWDLGLKVVRWLMGSFEARSWSHLTWTLPPALLGLVLCGALIVDLDALQLGAETAESLGIRLARTRVLALIAVALLVGAATAMAGVIGFVGLVVPHLARLTVGAAHARLMPTATAFGGLALLAIDIGTRAVTGLAIPPGVVTALLGAPLLVWMLLGQERAA